MALHFINLLPLDLHPRMEANTIPEFLYSTTLTIIDFHTDPSGGIQHFFVLGTRGTLKAAKSFCITCLQELNFDIDDFCEYHVRVAGKEGSKTWPYGEGVTTFAKAPAGQVFLVGVVTTLNNENLVSTPKGDLILPNGLRFLHYVLQTAIDFNTDRTGSVRKSELEGTYLHRADAWLAAYKCLDKKQMAQYDSRENPALAGQWPFGEDVAVHAVSETGQNFYVSVKIPPFNDTACKKRLVKTATKKPESSKAQFLPVT
jgi:hypothetical protein